MLNYLIMSMGPGSSPDPNIYYRTIKSTAEESSAVLFKRDTGL